MKKVKKENKKINVIFVIGVIISLMIVSLLIFNIDSDFNPEDYKDATKIYVYNNNGEINEDDLYVIITDEYIVNRLATLIGEVKIDEEPKVAMETDYLYYVKLVDENEETVLEFNIDPTIDILNNSYSEFISNGNYSELINILNIGEKIKVIGLFIETTTETLLYTEDNELIIISDATGKDNIFDSCSNGDTVEIDRSILVLSSDPSQVGAYKCDVIKDESVSNIPSDAKNLIESYGFEIKE